VAAGPGVGGYIAGAKPAGLCSAILSVIVLLCASVGGWLLTQQFKIGK
jgi:hypothetical protein